MNDDDDGDDNKREELEETKVNFDRIRSSKDGDEEKSILNDCQDSASAVNYETKVLANTFARKCKKIQQLDNNFNNLKLQISRAILQYDKNCTSAKNIPNQKPHAIFAQISKLFGDCDDLSREKINVAKSLYDDVDVEIQKLDDILHNLENCNSFSTNSSDLFAQLESNNNSTTCDKYYSNHMDNDQGIFGENLESTNMNLIDSKDEAGNRTTLLVDNEEDLQNFASSRLQCEKNDQAEIALNNSKSSSTATANNSHNDAKLLNFYNLTSEMPVDENEPRYCICNQVSYGHMIGCDNPECRIEWFHFTCVNITRKPRGTWLCPECSKGSNQ